MKVNKRSNLPLKVLEPGVDNSCKLSKLVYQVKMLHLRPTF